MSFDTAGATAATAQPNVPASDPGLGKFYALTQGVSALASLAGGISAMSAANREAEYQNAQADLIEEETYRDAAQRAREVKDFQARQSTKYVSSGITLEGTPLLMLEDTRRKGQEEIDALMKRGKAQADLIKLKSQIMRKTGRNSMFGSILGAAGQGLEGYIMANRVGIIGNKKRTPAPDPYGPTASYNPQI